MPPPRPNRFIYFLFPLTLAGLLYGVYDLMVLRFEKGDVYPPYSSLRSDPLGTKALYESLQEMKGLNVTRNYGPADRIEGVKGTTLFDLGDDVEDVLDVPVAMAPDVENYVIQGGRMIVSLVGENVPEIPKRRRWRDSETVTPTPTSTPSVTPTPLPASAGRAGKTPVRPVPPNSLATPVESTGGTFGSQWGVNADIETLPQTRKELDNKTEITYEAVTIYRDGDLDLPKSLPWHSGLYFKNLDPAWKVLYHRGDHPVIIERALGKGSLVLLADSYLVSNEALQKDRHADLLAYLAGERPRVIFDETHLGVYETDNTATLARKYGLGGFALGLAVLSLLFIWRNSMSLVPPREEESPEERGMLSGKDFSSGLINLLKRNIPAGSILALCFNQWKKTYARERKHLQAKVLEMEKELSQNQAGRGKAHPVEGYMRMSRILKKRR